MAGPSPEQVERFRTDFASLVGGATPRIGIAVSGGPDSLALLLLAKAAFPTAIEAATVDHGLRAESADEAKFVSGICAGLGVPHATLRPESPIQGNLQSSARAVRYRLLETWRRERQLEWLATAHHADDQAETLLMRLNRGSGLGGLSGVREVNGRVLRPLLAWPRAELQSIVDAAGLAAIADPANSDERFDRARIRRHMREAPWIDPAALSRSARAVAEAEAALAWTAERLAPDRISVAGDALQLDPHGLPAELRRRLLLAALRRINGDAAPRGDELSRLLTTLEQGGTATLAEVRCSGGENWRLEPAPPRRSR